MSNVVNLSSERIDRRREQLAEALRAEGASEAAVKRMANDDVAEKMLNYERGCVDMIITALFRGGKGLG